MLFVIHTVYRRGRAGHAMLVHQGKLMVSITYKINVTNKKNIRITVNMQFEFICFHLHGEYLNVLCLKILSKVFSVAMFSYSTFHRVKFSGRIKSEMICISLLITSHNNIIWINKRQATQNAGRWGQRNLNSVRWGKNIFYWADYSSEKSSFIGRTSLMHQPRKDPFHL